MKGSTRKYVDKNYLLCSTKYVLMKKCCQNIHIYIYIYIYIYISSSSCHADWTVFPDSLSLSPSISIQGFAEKFRLTKIHSWNLNKSGLFFNKIPITVHIFLPLCCSAWTPLVKKIHQRKTWHHYMNFSAYPCIYIYIYIYLIKHYRRFLSKNIFLIFWSCSIDFMISGGNWLINLPYLIISQVLSANPWAIISVGCISKVMYLLYIHYYFIRMNVYTGVLCSVYF